MKRSICVLAGLLVLVASSSCTRLLPRAAAQLLAEAPIFVIEGGGGGDGGPGVARASLEVALSDLIHGALAEQQSNLASAKSKPPHREQTLDTPAAATAELRLANLIRSHIRQEQALLGEPSRAQHSTTTATTTTDAHEQGPKTTGERRRRMSQVPVSMQRNSQLTDQLSAIQSLALLDEESFARVYKPKIMSTARGFGK